MTDCIIHIGMRKTGTSSIQKSIYRFSNDDYIYADIDGYTNHGSALHSLFSDNPGSIGFHINKKQSKSNLKKYIQNTRDGLDTCIDSANGRNVIFSGESLSYTLELAGLVRMRDFFLDRFDQVKIIASIRPPSGYIVSNFVQRVKERANSINIEHDYFEYKKNLSRFDEVFGRDNVHFWKFDPKNFPQGCAVRDFCQQMDISLPDDKIVRVNESLSREAISLLFSYRKMGKDLGSLSMRGPERKQLVESVAGLGKSKFRFSPDLIKPVLEMNRIDIEWMEDRLGESLYEELGEHQFGDVRDESDLLKPDPEIVSSLLSILGDSAPKGIKGETPEEVALLVHALRDDVSTSKMKPQKTAAGLNKGRIIRAEPEIVAGWVIGDDYENPVRVGLFVNGEEISQMLANKMRKGTKERGIHPSGCCGFVFRFNSKNRLKVGDEIAIKSADAGVIIAGQVSTEIASNDRE